MPGMVHCHLEWPKCPFSNNSPPYQIVLCHPLVSQNVLNITAINIDALTEAWATVIMHAKIGPNQCASIICNANTGASGNVMPLHFTSAELFPRCITRDGKPTGLHLCDTMLMAYNGSSIPWYGTLDTAIEGTPKGHYCSKHLQTRWYIADSTGPTIYGLSFSSKLGIVQLNGMVKLTTRHDKPSPPKQPTTEHAQVRCDLTSPLNSSEDLIKASLKQF